MCRSIKVLREGNESAPREEIEAAALQFVRKVSGFRQPSRINEAVFQAAVAEVADAAELLLRSLEVKAPAKAPFASGSTN